ncbi:hypothetical protein [Pseudaestuariivita sp.]|uniref:hypothetical protein n=1 Tax=Pseudaestuariivita sp. TaxID=2211669 RepID=UPI004058E992
MFDLDEMDAWDRGLEALQVQSEALVRERDQLLNDAHTRLQAAQLAAVQSQDLMDFA